MNDYLKQHLMTTSSISGIAIVIAVGIAVAAGKLDYASGASIMGGALALVIMPQDSTARTAAAQVTQEQMTALLDHVKKTP